MVTHDDLHDFLADWLQDLASQRKSPRTIDTYRHGVAAFLTHAEGADEPLARSTVRKYLTSLRSLAPATQRIRFLALRGWFKWLAEEKIIPESPMLTMKAPLVKAKPVTPYSDAELAALLSTCSRSTWIGRRDLAILRLLMTTGIRLSECTNLLTEHVNMDEKMIAVLGKGARWRVVGIDSATYKALSRYLARRETHPLAADPHLWLGQKGALGAKGLQAMVQRRASTAGIDGAFVHRFRHTAATNLLAKNVPESSVMSLFGWKSGDLLRRYVAATEQQRSLADFHKAMG